MATKQKLNEGKLDETEIEGFTFSFPKTIFTCLLVVCTGGLFLILLTWRSDIKLNCLYTKVPLKNALKVLLKDKFNQIFEEDVLYLDDVASSRYFVNKKIKYVWIEATQKFEKLSNLDNGMSQGEFYKCGEGLEYYTVESRLKQYGQNIIKISVPPVFHLLVHEALNPFYLFQAYTVILWSLQSYWKFAVIIAITSVISVTASVWETRKQNRNLRDKMKSESNVLLHRNGNVVEISSVNMVPGDVVLLPTNGGYMMECDAVLVEGTCVVNESMLTGESIPVTKIAVPYDVNTPFNYDLHHQHVVFCGTEVMQGKAQSGRYVKAIIIRTGFTTTKGELVRAILFPPPLDFAFHRDFLKSIYVFLSLGLIGMSYSLYVWIRNGGTMAECLLNSFDILTFVVPPILPAALTANNAFAQKRLQKEGIYCLHSKHICLCGGIDVVAFDKTGTLTDSVLNLAAICESKNAQFRESIKDPLQLPMDSLMLQCMATCHSLIKLEGELTGNPLDVKLFEAIEWELVEQKDSAVNPDYGLPTPLLVFPPKYGGYGGVYSSSSRASSNLEIAPFKTYPFDSAVQRMTVVAKKKGSSNFDVFIKGAPEKICGLSKPETVPKSFNPTLQSYTKQGLRVIAAAVKSLNSNLQWTDVDALPRAELEKNATFLGFIIMQNLVKEETYGAIKELHNADINTVMVTGDNILTAISVGRECELVKPDQTVIRVEAEICYSQQLNVSYTLEENEKSNIVHDSNFVKSVQEKNYVFACDGKTFGLIRNNDRALLDRIVQRGKVFARMLPEQKIHLIECMKDLGRQVIMCGDGCNDCGALKTAHAGISLSMAEASVAAPFTSRHVNISCVPYLIREGRSTMVSAFASFKFGVAFCFTQLIAVLMVFYIGTEPSDNQYLVVDIGLAAVPIVMIGNCGPYHSLVKQKPTRHLLSFLPLFSVISFLFFQTLCYVGVWFYVKTQSWFVPYKFKAGLYPPNPSYEQTNIFLLSGAAAVIAAIIYSKGSPYRKPLITNGIMAAWTICAAVVVVFMSLYRTEDFARRLNMKISPSFEYQCILVIIMICNCIFCYMWENYFLDGILFFKVLPWYKERIRGPHLPFEKLEQELKSKAGWPPIGDCKNNEIKIAVTVEGSSTVEGGRPNNNSSSPSPTGIKSPPPPPLSSMEKSSSYPLPDVTPAEIIREVRRNIKNRWSSTSPGTSPATEEDKTLLLSSPKDSSYCHQNHSVNISSFSSAASNPRRSTADNEYSSTTSSSAESKMLSRTDNANSLSTERKETSC